MLFFAFVEGRDVRAALRISYKSVRVSSQHDYRP